MKYPLTETFVRAALDVEFHPFPSGYDENILAQVEDLMKNYHRWDFDDVNEIGATLFNKYVEYVYDEALMKRIGASYNDNGILSDYIIQEMGIHPMIGKLVNDLEKELF